MHKPGHKFLSRLGAALTLIGGLLVATALGGVSPAGAATQWTPLTLRLNLGVLLEGNLGVLLEGEFCGPVGDGSHLVDEGA